MAAIREKIEDDLTWFRLRVVIGGSRSGLEVVRLPQEVLCGGLDGSDGAAAKETTARTAENASSAVGKGYGRNDGFGVANLHHGTPRFVRSRWRGARGVAGESKVFGA